MREKELRKERYRRSPMHASERRSRSFDRKRSPAHPYSPDNRRQKNYSKIRKRSRSFKSSSKSYSRSRSRSRNRSMRGRSKSRSYSPRWVWNEDDFINEIDNSIKTFSVIVARKMFKTKIGETSDIEVQLGNYEIYFNKTFNLILLFFIDVAIIRRVEAHVVTSKATHRISRACENLKKIINITITMKTSKSIVVLFINSPLHSLLNIPDMT